MLKTLIRRELLDNLMTFRFAAVLLITLLLVVANTVVLVQDYEQRLESYNDAVKMHRQDLRNSKTYSTAYLFVDRAPNPLSIFNIGLDKRLGNLIGIYHGFMPTLWDAQMHGTDNPFIAFFFSIDIVFVFEVILSLMGLIFAYDAIAGERERGTLRLVLAQPIGRGQILLAKYISAMACLLVPLILSLLFALLFLTRSIPLSIADFLRIAGIVFTSFAYLSLFYLIGLLISVATRRTGTALMLAMFVWGFLVLVYPNLIRVTVNPGGDIQARVKTAQNQIQQILDTYERERQKFLEKEGIAGETSEFSKALGFYHQADVDPVTLMTYIENMSVISEIRPDFEKYVPLAKRYYNFVGPLVTQTVEKAWRVRKQALDEIYVRQATTDRILLKLSPIGIYDAATQAWAGTDLSGLRDFFDTARRYRKVVIDYLYAKDAFSSREWFVADKGAVDWSTLPQFTFERSDVWTNAKRALPDLFLLLIANLVLFMGIVLIFIKSEV
ncbi:MAG: ABC transporter permease subunit [Candidatus Poribacteria bacterium]|nr:ABC transporter permease subunit [Candidatus Poribacteria bacterium]